MFKQTIFGRMLQEEWRMHTELFGKYRFGLFPVFMFLLTAAGTSLLTATGVEFEPLLLGLHILVVLFGLQTGSIAFIGTDAMRNVLGETTYLIYSARTLPVSQKRLLGIFLVKDLVYYAFLFLLPITLGFLPGALAATYSITAPAIALLWVTLTATFMLGVGITMIAVSLSTTLPFGKPLLLASVALGAVAAYLGAPLEMFTPYYLFTTPSITAALTGLVPVPVSLALAGLVFNPSTETPARTHTEQYTTLRDRLPLENNSMVSKMLLDLVRSSGGVWKVFFSASLILLVTWFLVQLATDIVALEPLSSLVYAVLLSLTAFTTYNWLTQNDDADEYLFQPLSVTDVFHAKQATFALLTIPVGIVFYGGMAIITGSSVLSTLIGVVVFAALSMYLFGLTVYLAGFSPNEFLFDTVLFMGFTAAVVAGFVPLLIVGFLFEPLTATVVSPLVALGGVTVFAILLAIVGVVLYNRATPKWTHHFQQE